MRSLIVIVFVIWVVAVVHDGYCLLEPDIIVHPEPLNVTLGSGVAFNCSAVADVVNWRINGLSSNHIVNREIFQTDVDTIRTGPNTYNSTLKLLVSTEDNATVECVAVSYSAIPSVFSREAVLLVQGLLEPPSLTEAMHNTSHHLLSWTPPFTLDITGTDPDITYRVCDNVTNTCVDTAETSYIFSATSFPVECNVSACNPVGCSEQSTITTVPVLLTTHFSDTGFPSLSLSTTSLQLLGSPSPTITPSSAHTDAGGDHGEVFFGIVVAAIGAVLVVTAVATVLALFTAVCVCRHWKQKGQPIGNVDNEPASVNILTVRNSAYVSHQPCRQKVKMEQSPAYNYVSPNVL